MDLLKKAVSFSVTFDGIIGLGYYIGECGESAKALEIFLESDVLKFKW